MLGQGCGHQGAILVIVSPSHKTICEKQHLQSFSFIYAVHYCRKKIQSRVISRKFSHNSISQKKELSLSSKFLKESYNNLGWKEFTLYQPPTTGPVSSLMKLLKAVSKKVSSMYKDGSSPTLLGKYSRVLHPHCAEIFSSIYWEHLTFLY